MDIYFPHQEKVNASMYWGEGRLIEKEIPACLTWQPLQEAPGNLWLSPGLFEHPMWKQYRPDEMQPLFFEVNMENFIQTIWVDEYDLKAYVRGWKNTPVFRLEKLQFLFHIEPGKLNRKEAEACFIIPGILTASSEHSEDDSFQSFSVPVLQKQVSFKQEFLSEDLDDCRLQVCEARLDDLPVTLVTIKELQSLQGIPPSEYGHQFKVVYDMVSGLLALLSQQNLQPVWQVRRQAKGDSNRCLELVYYDKAAPRRNNFPDDELITINFSLPLLYKALINKPLPAFLDYLRDVHSYKEILAENDILARFRKAICLLNRLIGWQGTDIATWPAKLKTTLDECRIYRQSRFIHEDIFMDESSYKKRWQDLVLSLHSLKVLVAGDSPTPDWFNGRKIKERNEIVTQLLAELIIAKQLDLSDIFPEEF